MEWLRYSIHRPGVLFGLSLVTLAFTPGPALIGQAPEPLHIANGDTNGDGNTDTTDVVYLLHHLFLAGPPPVPTTCEKNPPPCDGTLAKPRNGDTDMDGKINLPDAVRLLKYLFSSGPPPFPSCLCVHTPKD